MNNQVYRRAKTWQLAFFAMNNSATNVYMFLMSYISYYATGIAGLGVAIVGIISTSSRLWDAVTDPIVGWFIDKTNGKFGKFRPFMVLGNVILAVSVLVIYGTVHLVPEGFRLVYYILLYGVYIIGYTFQTACTKAGQACLTNDPAQRPRYSFYDSIFGAIVWAVLPIVASGPLYKWGGGFTEKYFMMFCGISIVLSAVFTFFAVIGIWSHDNAEYFGNGDEQQKVAVKDYLDVIKSNRALQMLVVSAASDKLAQTVKTSSVLMVVLFGVYMGNYSLYGTASGIVTIPSILMSLIGVGFAAKLGMKKTLVGFTLLDLGIAASMFAIAVGCFFTGRVGPEMGIWATIFVVLYCVLYCAETMSSSIVVPMIADCADYEVVRSGRYIPGMMGTLFSFVDKLISSLSTTVIAFGLVAIGFRDVQPVAEDPLTSQLFIFMLIMYFGLPVLGWILNLIAMKFYPLSKEKMEEIQSEIAARKSKMDAQ